MLTDLCHRAEADGIRLGLQRDGRHVHVTAVVVSRPEIRTSACVGGVPAGMACAWAWGGPGPQLATVNRRAGDPPLWAFREAVNEATGWLDAFIHAYPSAVRD